MRCERCKRHIENDKNREKERIWSNIAELTNVLMCQAASIPTSYGEKSYKEVKDLIYQQIKDIVLRNDQETLKHCFKEEV